MDFSLVDEQISAMSGLFLYASYNGDLSLQTSLSTLSTGPLHRTDPADRGRPTSETIWMWIAILATVGNIMVLGVVCACTF
ncbi:hypothetical protein GDO81_019611 [Engystomops pustulosus]|uniref:Uncharacterized protein n=1 Tax=Engystomops pustulosus TaxID=76066 RepID=A0AAV6ZUA0_ENGPU|nr:hypothetical protein GDO81_019611 [Engystomops pustulosus]